MIPSSGAGTDALFWEIIWSNYSPWELERLYAWSTEMPDPDDA